MQVDLSELSSADTGNVDSDAHLHQWGGVQRKAKGDQRHNPLRNSCGQSPQMFCWWFGNPVAKSFVFIFYSRLCKKKKKKVIFANEILAVRLVGIFNHFRGGEWTVSLFVDNHLKLLKKICCQNGIYVRKVQNSKCIVTITILQYPDVMRSQF